MVDAERRFFFVVAGTFAFVLACIGLTNFVVDPFGINPFFESRFARSELSPNYNSRLWKLAGDQRVRATRIILGDSRCDRLRAEYFDAVGASGYYNLSFGGASLYEIIDAFWHAANDRRLETVVLCIPFNLYDESNAANGVPDAVTMLSNPITYWLSPFVLRVSGALIWHRLTGQLQRRERSSGSSSRPCRTRGGARVQDPQASRASRAVSRAERADGATRSPDRRQSATAP